MHTIPEDAQRLANRLRMAADEIESAARHGVPIPYMISVTGHEFGRASMPMTEEEFTAWAEYTDAPVEDYSHHGSEWSHAEANVNGLPLAFAVQHEAAEVSA